MDPVNVVVTDDNLWVDYSRFACNGLSNFSHLIAYRSFEFKIFSVSAQISLIFATTVLCSPGFLAVLYPPVST